jgi:diaminohydroxyphosphoribosylaminopyrimidine deaminase / 5-amino-6-(5-phosphoribosylamino)uracil reductase
MSCSAAPRSSAHRASGTILRDHKRMITKRQESHMRWAIALALEGQGRTSPNPMVGALVVRDDEVIGEGFHRMVGGAHAEVNALSQAGEKARCADLYVTLEPCCHHGRTPPCVDAIIAAGIARVFIGARDPNPVVNGRGINILRKAGIEVVDGVLDESCRDINEAYNKFIVSGLPFVTAKVALSLDGKLATCTGDSRWITNAESRKHVHGMRSSVDAVMIGGGTVRRDDPMLTVRLGVPKRVQPRAIIVDGTLNIPRASKLLRRKKGNLIFVTTKRAPASRVKWLEEEGHEVIICRSERGDRVHIPRMMEELASLGITSILAEGGAKLHAGLFKSGLVDRVMAYIAPKIIGGEGLDFLPGVRNKTMKDITELKNVQIHTFGNDVLIEGDL